MAKLRYFEYSYEGKVYEKRFEYYCQGCKKPHYIDPDIHQFNGNYEKPTFSPSVLTRAWDQEKICHTFITNGMVQFLGDCYHDLKNQNLELPEIPEEC